jgi:hypothetical protein
MTEVEPWRERQAGIEALELKAIDVMRQQEQTRHEAYRNRAMTKREIRDRAKNAVRHAIRTGRLIPPRRCQCGTEGELHGVATSMNMID